MNTKSTIVAFGPSCSLAHQLLLRLRKNSTTDVPIIYILWIIVYASCIFPLYDLPSSHFENDGDYNSDLTANNWIFSIPSCFVFFNSSFSSFFFNNFSSSSCFYLCSFFYVSFSFAILYDFLIAFCAFMLLWMPKLWKHSQFPTINKKNFQWLPRLFSSLNIPPITFIFLPTHYLLINASSLKLIWPITITFCISCIATWKHFSSSL
jgi:hypothetical protein